jgi:phosphatidylglycerol:prolipoprotein diacylglycerol transferase
MQAFASVAAIGWEVFDRFRLGEDFAVSPHGLGIAIGFLAGSYVFVNREGPKRGISEDQASVFVFWALIGALVGARFFYVLAHFSEFDSIGEMLAVWRGGISLIGGITGSVIFGLPLMWRYRLSFLRVMDGAAIGLPLGIVIGRIGDLIIGDHLGKPSSWLLAFRYEGGNLAGYDCDLGSCTGRLFGGQLQTITPEEAMLRGPGGEVLAQGVGVHQTALYDFVSTMVLVLLLVYLNRVPRRTGVLFLTFAAWYGSVRIITDFLRVDKRFFGLTGSQWASVVVVIASLVTLAWFALRPERRSPEPATRADEGPETEPAPRV